MKTLTLLRHANALPAAIGEPDRGRRLSRGGHAEAEAVAEQLAARARPPDRVISSPAPRARDTAGHVLRALRRPDGSLEIAESLYPGHLEDWQDAVFALGALDRHALLVGHNPCISLFASQLITPREYLGLGTADWVCIDFDTDDWADCHAGGRLVDRGGP